MSLLAAWGVLAGLGFERMDAVSNTGHEVVLLYNQQVAESKIVADHYARARTVPADQVIGLNLPSTETISRDDYFDRLEKPLLRALYDRGLLTRRKSIKRDEAAGTEGPISGLVAAKVRYLVLCYGVPLRILEDANLKESGRELIAPELRRNEAAVDNELAALPFRLIAPDLTGPIRNRLAGATNASMLHPTNGILLVARLDGPSPAIARGLVEKALRTEQEGLWGRAYFDLRGLTNTSYLLGDQWLGNAAEICRRLGFETVVDRRPETLSSGFPLSQVAVYAGWYDNDASGPFARPTVEFMPGAFAYHLHSYSAATLRSETRHWVGPLLAKGATITLGSVTEPYLEGTPEISVFITRFLFSDFTFGEAAYACQGNLSWQTTVVGDPLYRPFALSAQALHEFFELQANPLLQWSHLRLLNLNLARGVEPRVAADHLAQLPLTATSPVLSEKLGDLRLRLRESDAAMAAYGQALALGPSDQQRVRLILTLSQVLAESDRREPAFALLEEFLKRSPDYPDRLEVCRRLQRLAEQLQRPDAVERYVAEIEKLSAPAGAPK